MASDQPRIAARDRARPPANWAYRLHRLLVGHDPSRSCRTRGGVGIRYRPRMVAATAHPGQAARVLYPSRQRHEYRPGEYHDPTAPLSRTEDSDKHVFLALVR